VGKSFHGNDQGSDVVMILGKGTGQQNKFMVDFTYMTNLPRLSWLNKSKPKVEGMIDMENNDGTIKVWAAEKQQKAERAPMM
jgi:hypothetical protein